MPPPGMLWLVTACPRLQLCQTAPDTFAAGEGAQITAPGLTCSPPAGAERVLGRGGGGGSAAPRSEVPRATRAEHASSLDFGLLWGLEQDPRPG